jgi:hypothetical protein
MSLDAPCARHLLLLDAPTKVWQVNYCFLPGLSVSSEG